MIPNNLKLERVAVSAAELPGLGPFWIFWRLLDPRGGGQIVHAECLGYRPAQKGETAAAVLQQGLPQGSYEERG